jgi:hypothetical protein
MGLPFFLRSPRFAIGVALVPRLKRDQPRCLRKMRFS